MNALEWIVPRTEMLIFTLNLVVAVTLIAGAGLIAARMLVHRSAPLRYGLLTSASLFVLLSPAIVFFVGQSGWSPLTWTVSAPVPVLVKGPVATRTMTPLATEIRGHQAKDAESGVEDPKPRAAEQSSEVGSSPVAKNSVTNSVTASPVSWWQIAGGLLLGLWAVGLSIAVARLGQGCLAISRLRRTFRSPDDARIERLANRATRSLGLRGSLRVFESAVTPVPISFGLLRPAIVLPEDIGGELDDAQLESVLLHEAAHVARGDHWVGLMGRLAAVLFWWHPLVHGLNRRLADLREDICDNFVVRQQGNSRGYAVVLVKLATRTSLRPALPAAIGLLENESDGLEGRVRRLLKKDRTIDTRLSLPAIGILATFVLLLAGVLLVTGIRAEPAETKENKSTTKTPATVTVKTRDALIRAVRNATPGTKILIAAGTYDGGLRFANLQGEQGRPIILAAADPKHPPVISGGTTGLHLIDPVYVELHHLVITKSRVNGLNIDDGGSYDSPAHHIVLSELVVREIGSDRNHDGIKLSGVNDFRIENCTVERWGKSGSGIDMVGCHRGVITGSTFRHGDKIFGSGVQIKGGSREIAVSYCRFENAGGRAINIGGSTGLPYFRPKPQGYEAKDITVADCTFIGSMASIAFVGVDGANVHHNTIYRPTRWVMRILQENQNEAFVPCRNGRFTNNIVVFHSDEVANSVNIGGKVSAESFKFAENFWYCMNRPEKTERAVRLPTKEEDGVYGHDPMFVNPKQGDLTRQENSPAQGAGPQSKRSD